MAPATFMFWGGAGAMAVSPTAGPEVNGKAASDGSPTLYLGAVGASYPHAGAGQHESDLGP